MMANDVTVQQASKMLPLCRHLCRCGCLLVVGFVLSLGWGCGSLSPGNPVDRDERFTEAWRIDADIGDLERKGSLTEMEQATLFGLFNKRFFALHNWGDGEESREPTTETLSSVTTVVAGKTSNAVSRVSVFGAKRVAVETKSREGLRRTFYLINVANQWRIIGEIGGPDFF